MTARTPLWTAHVIVLASLLGMLTGSCASMEPRSPLDQLADMVPHVPPHRWGYEPPAGDGLVDTHARLRRAAYVLHIPILEVPDAALPPDVAGQYVPETRTIMLRMNLSFDGQVQVVSHELCHAVQPPGFDVRDRETFAEACAYLVTRPERDDLMTFARYLARYRSSAPATIRAFKPEIRWAAAFLRGPG